MALFLHVANPAAQWRQGPSKSNAPLRETATVLRLRAYRSAWVASRKFCTYCIERAAAAGPAWPRLVTDDPNLYSIREGPVVIAANQCIGCIGDAFSLVLSVTSLRGRGCTLVVDLPSASRHNIDVRRASSNADQSPETGFKVCDSIRQDERGHGATHYFF